jgi:hypothetical protein
MLVQKLSFQQVIPQLHTQERYLLEQVQLELEEALLWHPDLVIVAEIFW